MLRDCPRPILAFLFCLLLAGSACAQQAAQDATAARSDRDVFDRDVAPLLARRCLECHNGSDQNGELDLTRRAAALAGGSSGPALVPGNLEESQAWQRVLADEMPPKKPLSAAEKETLRAWIASGAAWSRESIDRFQFTSDARAGYDWWAWQSVQRPALPAVRDTAWPRGPIDQFILARLESTGLSPSRMADRRVLIRRLAFDLTGLPPTAAEIADFVNDADPNAYEKLVDRLLASPHYGERWARHWLDLARFGESNGFEYDEPRKNAWPYRDWVVAALNQDLPFDEFTRQQLAGDILHPGDPLATQATGFLVAGAYDTAGQNQQSLAMKAVVRQDELEDMVGTISQTFLALTVHCARCHDHKFDPVRQSEYYRLTSALGGVRHGERDVTTEADRARFARQLAAREQQTAEVTARLKSLEEPARGAILAERRAGALPRPEPPPAYARWDFDHGLNDELGQLHATVANGAVAQGGLRVDGRKAFAATVPLDKDITAKTLEAWVSLADLRQAGGGVMTLQSLDGGVFDSIVFGEREPGCWLAGSDGFSRTQAFDGPAETEADKRLVHLAIVYAADGTVTGYRDGRPYGKSYRTAPPVTYRAGAAQIVFGMRHGPAGGNKMLSGLVARAKLYDRALSADEIAAAAGEDSDYVGEQELLARLSPEQRMQRDGYVEQLRQLQQAPRVPSKQMCYAVTPRASEPARLLVRGDIRQPTDVVSAGGVQALTGASADFGLAPDAPEGERRAALARWIASERNPLFARVIVNRLWHYHFGVGLVDTPNDFGFNGGRPTHPELLDWLASRLVEQGWSLKRMHREIVLSATYRQASTRVDSAVERDADNRLLWRKTPQRLEAEAVRDTILTVAGQLNRAMGGDGFRDSTEVLRSGTFTYEPGDPEGPAFQRRSLYRAWIRGGRSGLLDTFDCPDPSTTAPRRALTTTPLQALALLNNSFVLRMADRFAERIAAEAPGEPEQQVAHAYQLAFGRAPTAEEQQRAAEVVRQVGLPVLTRAIFNSNEFLYVD